MENLKEEFKRLCKRKLEMVYDVKVGDILIKEDNRYNDVVENRYVVCYPPDYGSDVPRHYTSLTVAQVDKRTGVAYLPYYSVKFNDLHRFRKSKSKYKNDLNIKPRGSRETEEDILRAKSPRQRKCK